MIKPQYYTNPIELVLLYTSVISPSMKPQIWITREVCLKIDQWEAEILFIGNSDEIMMCSKIQHSFRYGRCGHTLILH